MCWGGVPSEAMGEGEVSDPGKPTSSQGGLASALPPAVGCPKSSLRCEGAAWGLWWQSVL